MNKSHQNTKTPHLPVWELRSSAIGSLAQSTNPAWIYDRARNEIIWKNVATSLTSLWRDTNSIVARLKDRVASIEHLPITTYVTSTDSKGVRRSNRISIDNLDDNGSSDLLLITNELPTAQIAPIHERQIADHLAGGLPWLTFRHDASEHAHEDFPTHLTHVASALAANLAKSHDRVSSEGQLLALKLTSSPDGASQSSDLVIVYDLARLTVAGSNVKPDVPSSDSLDIAAEIERDASNRTQSSMTSQAPDFSIESRLGATEMALALRCHGSGSHGSASLGSGSHGSASLGSGSHGSGSHDFTSHGFGKFYLRVDPETRIIFVSREASKSKSSGNSTSDSLPLDVPSVIGASLVPLFNTLDPQDRELLFEQLNEHKTWHRIPIEWPCVSNLDEKNTDVSQKPDPAQKNALSHVTILSTGTPLFREDGEFDGFRIECHPLDYRRSTEVDASDRASKASDDASGAQVRSQPESSEHDNSSQNDDALDLYKTIQSLERQADPTTGALDGASIENIMAIIRSAVTSTLPVPSAQMTADSQRAMIAHELEGRPLTAKNQPLNMNVPTMSSALKYEQMGSTALESDFLSLPEPQNFNPDVDPIVAIETKPAIANIAPAATPPGSFSGLADLITDGIIITDDKEQIIEFNDGANQIWNLRLAEHIGQTIDSLFDKEGGRKIRESIGYIAPLGASRHFSNEVFARARVAGDTTDQWVAVAAKIGKSPDNNENFFVAITDNRRFDRKLREKNHELTESNHFKSVQSDLVAHYTEITGPLIDRIAGFASSAEVPPTVAKAISQLQITHEDMTRINAINNKNHSLNFGRLDLNAVLTSAIDRVSDQISASENWLRTRQNAEVPPVIADPETIRILIERLIAISLDRAKSGAQITVSTGIDQNNVYLRLHEVGMVSNSRAASSSIDGASDGNNDKHDAANAVGDKYGHRTSGSDILTQLTNIGLGVAYAEMLAIANRGRLYDKSGDGGVSLELVFPTSRVLSLTL